MDWLLTNTQIHSTFASLGCVQGEHYVTSGDCLEILEEINYKLEIEDTTLRSFRRAIGFGQNVRNDIIPLLVNVNIVKDPKIVEAVIRILVNLTIPVECLLPVETMLASDMGRHTVFELNKLLINVKESFTDSKTTKSVLEYMKFLLEGYTQLGKKNCGEMNNCLLLLRNILNIPENLHKNYFNLPRTSMQNQIVWNLFTQSIDKILLQLMTCPERSQWCVTMVQLIALMYKDQHVNTLQKLLNICFEASISDSSEDNESNTSPVKESNSDSSPLMTSDPTSDSSDNGGAGTKRICDDRRNSKSEGPVRNDTPSKRKSEEVKAGPSKDIGMDPDHIETEDMEQPSNIISGSPGAPSSSKSSGVKKRTMLSPTSELSDCGYGTQVENPESISTSSTEEYSKPPVHQKPPATNQKQRMNSVNKPRKVLTTQEKTEWRRKKLVKRSRSTMINMKGLINHTPTDDDITNILKEFTVDFLLKSYGLLVEDLHDQLMMTEQLKIDTSHFFWLVTYFLKFAAQLELDLEHVQTIFTFDIIGYSMYEAVSICEQLDAAGSDLVPSLRRLHLSVTAIREFLHAIETYKKISHLRKEDLHYLMRLESQIASSDDLRNLFILLLRRFNPSIHSKQYLQDVIVTNHKLLILLDRVSGSTETGNFFIMRDHIRQFASVDIMHWYGYQLEDFNENGDFVNDCIFTMMHHIAGDMDQVTILFQPIILKAFSKIWDTEFELCEDWSDLVEYVINKFISNPQNPGRNNNVAELMRETCKTVLAPPPPPQQAFDWDSPQDKTGPSKSNHLWTDEEIDSLNWYFIQTKDNVSPIEDIRRQFRENSNTTKSEKDIADQLLAQRLIGPEMAAKYSEPAFCQLAPPRPASPLLATDQLPPVTVDQCEPPIIANHNHTDDVQFLCQKLYQEHPSGIVWLQRVLLECCFIKLRLEDGVGSNRDLLTLENSGGLGLPCVMEPIMLIYILKKQSVPLIPWTNEQLRASTFQPFILLLHKLGFHMAADARKLYARIPEFWTHDHLFSVARKLGPISQRLSKFTDLQCGTATSKDLLSDVFRGGDSDPRRPSIHSGLSTTLSASMSNWMDSPNVAGGGDTTARSRQRTGTTDESNISGPTDTSTDAFPSKSLSLQSNVSSRKQSLEEIGCQQKAEVLKNSWFEAGACTWEANPAHQLASPVLLLGDGTELTSGVWETASQVSMCVSASEDEECQNNCYI